MERHAFLLSVVDTGKFGIDVLMVRDERTTSDCKQTLNIGKEAIPCSFRDEKGTSLPKYQPHREDSTSLEEAPSGGYAKVLDLDLGACTT